MNRATLLRRLSAAILCFLCAWMLAPSAVQAGEETWQVRSTYPYKVQLKFYSQDRKHVWPSAGESWVLDDSRSHSFRLTCRPGERICYGAWNVASGGRLGTKFWGVGFGDKHGCQRCCWTCGREGDPRAITLTP